MRIKKSREKCAKKGGVIYEKTLLERSACNE